MNTNCLEGLRCPRCGALEPFVISARCFVTVYDDGTDNAVDFEWTLNDWISCSTCSRQGMVGDFRAAPNPLDAESGEVVVGRNQ